MAIDVPKSTSTDAELRAFYEDNASYHITGSVTEAQVFISACRIMIGRYPTSTTKDGEGSMEISIEELRHQLDDAKKWIAAKSIGQRRVTHVAIDSRHGRNSYGY